MQNQHDIAHDAFSSEWWFKKYNVDNTIDISYTEFRAFGFIAAPTSHKTSDAAEEKRTWDESCGVSANPRVFPAISPRMGVVV
jgi:hypothetical protein